MLFRTGLSLVLLLLVAAGAASAQTVNFTDPNVSYSVDFPNSTWRITAKPDETRGQAEWVYGDRTEGYLVIRKDSSDAGTTITEFAHTDRDNKLHFLPGYVDGIETRFAGNLSGVVLQYEYTASGKPMVGIIYYLQADARTVYSLRFSGYRDKLARIRSQTDGIARSFKLKP